MITNKEVFDDIKLTAGFSRTFEVYGSTYHVLNVDNVVKVNDIRALTVVTENGSIIDFVTEQDDGTGGYVVVKYADVDSIDYYELKSVGSLYLTEDGEEP